MMDSKLVIGLILGVVLSLCFYILIKSIRCFFDHSSRIRSSINVFGDIVLPLPEDPRWTRWSVQFFTLGNITVDWKNVIITVDGVKLNDRGVDRYSRALYEEFDRRDRERIKEIVAQ